jgi:hypothetical protein
MKRISNNKKGGILIDKVLKDTPNVMNDKILIEGVLYAKKPTKSNMSFIGRIRGAIRILRNRGLVVYFKEDE